MIGSTLMIGSTYRYIDDCTAFYQIQPSGRGEEKILVCVSRGKYANHIHLQKDGGGSTPAYSALPLTVFIDIYIYISSVLDSFPSSCRGKSMVEPDDLAHIHAFPHWSQQVSSIYYIPTHAPNFHS